MDGDRSQPDRLETAQNGLYGVEIGSGGDGMGVSRGSDTRAQRASENGAIQSLAAAWVKTARSWENTGCESGRTWASCFQSNNASKRESRDDKPWRQGSAPGVMAKIHAGATKQRRDAGQDAYRKCSIRYCASRRVTCKP